MAIEVPFMESRSPRTCAVLGGRGFLGRSLVAKLLQLGDWIVRVADSAHSLQLDLAKPPDALLQDAITSGRASYHHLNVRDISRIAEAIEGSSVVFYMEADDLQAHDFYLCYITIVQGAKNVIHACQECRVRQLIYNSTADIIFDGSHDIRNGDESLPCSWKFLDMLTDLKAQAEALILYANNIDGLLTCALRPSNVFGPGDTRFIPLLVNLAKSGWGKFIVGSGDNLSDFTYTENVTHAHICAAEALNSRMISVAGKAFFITNLEPMKFWEFVSLILEGLGCQRPMIKLPARIVWYAHLIFKWTREKLAFRKYNHSLSCHFFHLASRTRTFNCTAAEMHIGYSPVVSMEDGISLTIESFSQSVGESSLTSYSNFEVQSKVEKLLGSGKVADILLWRNERETFTYFLVLSLSFYWFLLSGRTFTSSIAKLVLLIITIMFGYGCLPSTIYGFSIPRISFSWFEVSETSVKDSISSIAYLWNRGVHNMKLLAQGENWTKFFKLASSLYFLKWVILLQALSAVIGAGLVFAFTAFFVYEQYETEIDALAAHLFSTTRGFFMRNLPASLSSYFRHNSDRQNGYAVNEKM